MNHLARKILVCTGLALGMMFAYQTPGWTHCGCHEWGFEPCGTITCNAGYTCTKYCRTCVAYGDCCHTYCEAPTTPGNTFLSGLLDKTVELISASAYATHGDLHQGYRNGVNKSSSGVAKDCAARLHVCFIGGIIDSALSGVDTTNECNNACDTMQSPNQIACSYSDCQSRCYAGLVPGYADSCT